MDICKIFSRLFKGYHMHTGLKKYNMGKPSQKNNGKGGSKKRPTRQASLLKKPVIEVRGKLGKAQKSKKRKIKKIGASSAEFYEAKVDGDREKTTR